MAVAAEVREVRVQINPVYHTQGWMEGWKQGERDEVRRMQCGRDRGWIGCWEGGEEWMEEDRPGGQEGGGEVERDCEHHQKRGLWRDQTVVKILKPLTEFHPLIQSASLSGSVKFQMCLWVKGNVPAHLQAEAHITYTQHCEFESTCQ